MPDRYVDTDISLHRSEAYEKAWTANLPGTEVWTVMASAGPLPYVKRWVLAHASHYGWDDVTPASDVQWRRPRTGSEAHKRNTWLLFVKES